MLYEVITRDPHEVRFEAETGFAGGCAIIGGGVVIVPALIILLDLLAFLPPGEVTA